MKGLEAVRELLADLSRGYAEADVPDRAEEALAALEAHPAGDVLDALDGCVQRWGPDEEGARGVAIDPRGLDAAIAVLQAHGRL